jgi:hypothetical protein
MTNMIPLLRKVKAENLVKTSRLLHPALVGMGNRTRGTRKIGRFQQSEWVVHRDSVQVVLQRVDDVRKVIEAVYRCLFGPRPAVFSQTTVEPPR